MHRFDYYILSTSLIFLSKLTGAEQTTTLDCLSNRNPCKNGGSCSLSTNKCICPDGYSGNICELIDPEVKCLSDRIEVHIQKSWAAHYAKIQSAEQLYIGEENEDLENCRAVDFDKNHYILTVDAENSCGTDINRDNETLDFVYSNSVYSNRFKKKESENKNSPLFGLSSLMKRLPAFRLMSLVQWTCYYQHKERRVPSKNDPTHEIDQLLEQENIQFSTVLSKSTSSVEIQTFNEPTWNEENRLHPKTYKKSLSGKKLFFEVSTIENFVIQECALVNKPGDKNNNLDNPDYHQKVLVNSGGCLVHEKTSTGMPVTKIITNSPQKLRFSVIIERQDWTEIGYEKLDPTVYVHCILQQAKLQKPDQNGCPKDKPETHPGFVEIEAGPFQILRGISEETATSVEIEGGDDEHSAGIRRRTRPASSSDSENFMKDKPKTPPIEIIYEILSSLENDAGETRESAWEKMKIFIEKYQISEMKEMPIVKLESNYQLQDDILTDEVPIFSVITVEDTEIIKSQLQTMVILAIAIGCVFLVLIATPVIITCCKNRSKHDEKSAKGKKTIDVPRSPVEKAVETMKQQEDKGGINVDHELYFVEYADNVHDLVWGQNQQEQAGWIKQQSIDAQSIDISTNKPYDSSYDSGMTFDSVPLPSPRTVLPSYVVLGKNSSYNGPGPRKISDQLQEENIIVNDEVPGGHPRRGSIKLAGITIFGGCTGGKVNSSKPYKFKEKKRGHV